MRPLVTCVKAIIVRDEDTIDGIWNTYSQAFADAKEKCIQDQTCYDRGSLAVALADPDYLKFILREGNEVIGFTLITNDLEKARVAYVNPERLRKEYPQECAQGKVFYFTAICLRPDRQDNKMIWAMFQAIAEWVAQVKPLIAFDYSTEKTSFLPNLLLMASKRTVAPVVGHEVNPTFTKLGGQEYGILRIL